MTETCLRPPRAVTCIAGGMVQGFGRLQNSAMGDIWVPITVFVACAVSLGIGISKVVGSGQVRIACVPTFLIPPLGVFRTEQDCRSDVFGYMCHCHDVSAGTSSCGHGHLVM